MAKGRNRGNRETKKPKAEKRPVQISSTFLRPQQAVTQPAKKKSTS